MLIMNIDNYITIENKEYEKKNQHTSNLNKIE